MKKWFTETRNVDIETGENLSKSRLEREDYIKVGGDYTIQDCGAYLLKIYTHHYEKNKQYKITFEW